MELINLKLSKLRPGGSINSRRHGQDLGGSELYASIKQLGLLQPLTARPIGDGKYEIIAGNRRFSILKRIHGEKDAEVPVIVRESDDEDACEASLAENVVRVNIHPVDEYEAYERLIEQGSNPYDIAKRFGVKVKWVRERLQLASLAPELRDAWKKGDLSAEQAAALSSVPDHDLQRSVWTTATKDKHNEWARRPENLRSAMRHDFYSQDDAAVKFVGLDAYKENGGRLSDDLFTEDRTLLDKPIVDRLVAEKLAVEVLRLRNNGWAWVCADDDLPCQSWQIKTLDLTPWMTDAEKKAHAKAHWNEQNAIMREVSLRAIEDSEARSKSGVIVGVSAEGQLELDAFRVLPSGAGHKATNDDDPDDNANDDDEGSAPAPKRDVKEDPKEDERALTAALVESLSENMTVGISRALAADPLIALRALYATLATELNHRGASTPLRISTSNAWAGLNGDASVDGDWSAHFNGEATFESLARSLAPLIARTLDFRVVKYDHYRGRDYAEVRDTLIDALAGQLDGDSITRELREVFNPADYFKRVSIADCTAAIVETDGRNTCSAKTKAEIAAHAVARVRATGWLPKELRTPHYTGPGRRLAQAAE